MEEIINALSGDGAETFDGGNVVDRSRHQRIDAAERLGQQAGVAVADVADPQTGQHPSQSAVLAGGDGSDQVRRRLLSHPFQPGDLLLGQLVQVRQFLDQTLVDQLVDHRRAESFDVHRAAVGKEAKPFLELGRTGRVDAADVHAAFVALDRTAANRTPLRERELLLFAGPFLQNDADDVGNDLARLFDHHRVADANVFAADFVGVVQADARDLGPGDFDGFEIGDRRQHAGLADLDGDVLDPRRRLPQLDLVGDDPSRRLAGGAEPVPLGEVVDLDDHAVGLVVEFVPPLELVGAVLKDGVDGIERSAVGNRRQAETTHQAEELVVSSHRNAFEPPFAMGEEAQPPLGALARIEQFERAGGGVARIGQLPFPPLRQNPVQPRQLRIRHVHFAANLDHFGRRLVVGPQSEWNVVNSPQVGGDVVATLPVASRRAECEQAVFVRQRHRHAVDLLLDHVAGFFTTEPSANAAVEIAKIVLVVGVVDGQHRHGVADRLEPLQRLSTDTLRRAVRRDQFRMLRLQFLQPLHQPIEVEVADHRLGFDIVLVIVELDFAAESADLFFDRQLVQLGKEVGNGCGHDGLRRIRAAAAGRNRPGGRGYFQANACPVNRS